MIFPYPMSATARRSAFTLVEVMVSIAVALLLLLGVNQVFHATAVTTGAGLALSTSQQMSRTVKATLQNDLKNGAWDTGVLVIRNEQVYAFRNAADQQSAADPNDPSKPDPSLPTTLFPKGVYRPYVVNSRSHRVDRIGFFARGFFDRQTSPGPFDTVPVQANEAWVWYGHLALPNNNVLKGKTRDDFVSPQAPGQYFGPGAPNTSNATNDNNFFATDWALGRFATLLLGLNPNANDNSAASRFNRDYLQFGSSSYATPLTYDSTSAIMSGSSADFAYESLHDAAWESIADFKVRLAGFISANKMPASGVPWYYSMIGVESQPPQAAVDHRYQACPYIPSVGLDANNTGRLSPTSLALAAPIVGRGCCHFIVEYAGNYLTQVDAPGTIPTGSAKPDGTVLSATPSPNPDHIDYVSVYDPTTGQYVRKIRWYGYPRDTNGIPGIQYDDVLPLRDVLALNNAGYQAQFEHFGFGFPNAPSGGQVPTSGPNMQSPSNSLVEYDALGSQPDYSYTCAWGPYPPASPPPGMANWPNYGLPSLLRITVVFDDPNGRLGTEQSYEYIIDLRN